MVIHISPFKHKMGMRLIADKVIPHSGIGSGKVPDTQSLHFPAPENEFTHSIT